MLFTDFYVSQAVCSTSRASLMIGIYAERVGIQGALIPWAVIGLDPVTQTIDANIGTTFYVGMVSSYYFASLSAEPAATGIGSQFIVIRSDVDDIVFESSKNPIDPVEIGIAEGKNIGRGHKLELINNGDPNILSQWKEVQEEPEPRVGAGRVEYYVGNFQWPTITTRNADGDVNTTHAVIGQRVIVSAGASVGTSIGYTGTPPSGAIPGDCGDYDTAIVTAENNLAEEIARNVPVINHYINGADALRQLRNDDETNAWGLLQALGYNTIFDQPVNTNPLPWTTHWLSSSGLQVAPQETEVESYIIGGIKQDVDKDALKGFSL